MPNDYINDPTDPAYPLGEPPRDPQDIEEELQWLEERDFYDTSHFHADEWEEADDEQEGSCFDDIDNMMFDIEFEDRMSGDM